MQSSVKVDVTVERATWFYRGGWGATWLASWNTPFGQGGASFAVVDDFGNLVAVEA